LRDQVLTDQAESQPREYGKITILPRENFPTGDQCIALEHPSYIVHSVCFHNRKKCFSTRMWNLPVSATFGL